MPTYEYLCPHCRVKQTHFLKLSDHTSTQPCGCGHTAEQLLSPPMISADYPGYVSPATGRWVEGRKAHIEDLKRSGCRLLEPGESRDAMKKTAARQQAFEAEVDSIVEKAAQTLPL